MHKHANTAANSRGAVIYLDFTANKVCTQSGSQSCSAGQSTAVALFCSAQWGPINTTPTESDNRKRLLTLCAREQSGLFCFAFCFTLRREEKKTASWGRCETKSPIYIARARSANSERAATIYCAVTSCTVLFMPNALGLRHKNDTDAHRWRQSESAKSFLRPGATLSKFFTARAKRW